MPRYNKRKDKPTFVLFNKLPVEIQLAIWTLCLPQQRIIPLQLSINRPRERHCCENTIEKLLSLPDVARVCRTARTAALIQQRKTRLHYITRPNPELDGFRPEPEAFVPVPFDPAADVVFINAPPTENVLFSSFAPADKPHLISLMSNPNTALCATLAMLRRHPDVLHRVAQSSRKTFHLVLGQEFVIHMPRAKAVKAKIFGTAAEEVTIMIGALKADEIAPYELAYNKTRRGGGHGCLSSIAA